MAFLAGLSGIMSVASGVLGAIGAMQSAAAQKAAADYNARVMEQQAEAERDRAGAVASDFRRRNSFQVATARAERAASGIQFAGTPIMVDTDMVQEIELGASRAAHEGEMRANRLKNEAELSRMQGRAAKTAGSINAGRSILSMFRGFN